MGSGKGARDGGGAPTHSHSSRREWDERQERRHQLTVSGLRSYSKHFILPVAAAAARVAGSRAYYLASSENIQTHGGMGFTWELDCHLYYRRAKLLNLSLGGERRWKDKLIARLENRNAAA